MDAIRKNDRMGESRIEQDTMGPVKVPADVYWGAQTQRAIENFPISGWRFSPEFIKVMGWIKAAAAEVNMELGLLDRRRGRAICNSSREVAALRWNDQFPVDIFESGSGTSIHMNVNEVIANRANKILSAAHGPPHPVHPNDHVNLGQSSNDVVPTCIHIVAAEALEKRLIPALLRLRRSLYGKARQFGNVLTIGRTHLQDAAPVSLGKVFAGYACMVDQALKRLRSSQSFLMELALGGTAVGTGINAHPRFAAAVIRRLRRLSGLPLREAKNHFAAQGAQDAVVQAGTAVKSVAITLLKIADDIRWLGSGPRGGIGVLSLPAVQPGSSIMPGKINPVIAESLIQVCAQVIGHEAAIAYAGALGHFELQTMLPMMAYNLFQSIDILSSAAANFAHRCVSGVRADRRRCRELLERNLAAATALVPRVGYDNAAAIAQEAQRRGKTIREVVLEKNLLPADELERLLDPWKMAGRR